MKLTKRNLVMAVVFTLLTLLAQDIYANGGGRRGRDDDYYSRKRYYRRSRYYPRDYYYQKKIYFYPRKRYYYYYDVYPDKTYYYNWEKAKGVDNPDYLPVTSIANMASQGVPESVIISEIERTKSRYQLDSETISYLKQNGASDTIIDTMLNTNR